MKKMLLLVGALTIVRWDLQFTPQVNQAFVTMQRSKTFTDVKEAQLFMDRAPKGWFECIESDFNQMGYCSVGNLRMTGKKVKNVK